ncbi:uncharacterized protein LOC126982438 isoform X3 [Eriocheir sinensis]|uniref:uncharacterized protein LOC126982438 isoform X3 n=1 Tax=Eriocheir sinensis TaxID=95602 RepID=UPI0021C8F548|nr:uncharacterized protein LOC126982438 isoform X3 [Eriocheir sinensis]
MVAFLSPPLLFSAPFLALLLSPFFGVCPGLALTLPPTTSNNTTEATNIVRERKGGEGLAQTINEQNSGRDSDKKDPKDESNTQSTTTPHSAWGFVGVVGLVVGGVKCRRRQKSADPSSPTPQVPPRPSPEDGYVEPNPVLPRHAPDGHQGSTRHPMLSRARSRTSSTNIYDEIPLPGRNQTRLLRQDSNGYVMMLPTPLQPHRESAESEGDSRKSFRPPPWYEARQPPTSSPAQQTTRSGTPNLLEL